MLRLTSGLGLHNVRRTIQTVISQIWSLDFSKPWNSGYVGAIL